MSIKKENPKLFLRVCKCLHGTTFNAEKEAIPVIRKYIKMKEKAHALGFSPYQMHMLACKWDSWISKKRKCISRNICWNHEYKPEVAQKADQAEKKAEQAYIDYFNEIKRKKLKKK